MEKSLNNGKILNGLGDIPESWKVKHADMKDGEFFTLKIKESYFGGVDNFQAKVVTKPHRKWYKLLLERISFGLYFAPYEYKIEKVK